MYGSRIPGISEMYHNDYFEEQMQLENLSRFLKELWCAPDEDK